LAGQELEQSGQDDDEETRGSAELETLFVPDERTPNIPNSEVQMGDIGASLFSIDMDMGNILDEQENESLDELPRPTYFDEAFFPMDLGDFSSEQEPQFYESYPLEPELQPNSERPVLHSPGVDFELDTSTRQQAPQPKLPKDTVQESAVDVDRTIAADIDFVCHLEFRLPQDCLETDPVSAHDIRTLLSPFQDNTSLGPHLLAGLLYALLPGGTKIMTIDHLNDVCADLLKKEPHISRFALLVVGSGDPALMLGDIEADSIYYLGTSNMEALELSERVAEHLNRRIEKIEVSASNGQIFFALKLNQLSPGADYTLYLLHRAEMLCSGTSERFLGAQALRRRYLKELVAPYRTHGVLEGMKIPHCGVPAVKVDMRDMIASPTIESPLESPPFEIHDLEGFNHGLLQQALSKARASIGTKKTLRILQCISEIGSEEVLGSLQASLNNAGDTNLQHETPVVQKLLHIHQYLDEKETESHIAIAKNRYVKYCYFEIFQLAARLVSTAKELGHKERHKVMLRKASVSWHLQIFDDDDRDLPSTPNTDGLERLFSGLSIEERKKPATAMLKLWIAKQLETNGNRERIKRSVDRYLREGKIMHLILQGVNPSLLILFPGFQTQEPSLDPSQFSTDPKLLKSLRKPICVRE
jgi:hypothetical protein